MWGSASVEACLTNLIADHMPSLSRRMHHKLFIGYGPLSGFRPKSTSHIAWGISQTAYGATCVLLGEVRNAFAHATDLLHFDDTQFDPLLEKFPHYYDEDRVEFS
jgi:hypothetical protein